MILTRTPFRISFFGGGTDYPEWYRQEEGAVLSTTIDKHCYISCRVLPPFFRIRHRIVWSHIETVDRISEILHPAVREGLRYMGFDESVGLEIHHQGDLPARAGIGTSSAFAVGLIHALAALRGERIEKADLARRAIELEQNVLRDNVGCQDQVAVAFGGFNVIRFPPSGEFRVDAVSVPEGRLLELQSRLMLFYTGSTRLASEVAADFVANMDRKRSELRRMRAMVDEGLLILREGDLDDFGRLLHEAWVRKRGISSAVSSPTIDRIYSVATASGALGGKLLGAGASGFMVFYVPKARQPDVQRALGAQLHVPFQFEKQGSLLVYGSGSGD